MEQPKSSEKAWLYFVLIAFSIIAVAAVHWSLDHPYGTSWDEAQYINEVHFDAQRLRNWMLLRLLGRLLLKSWIRPPAYRLLALPFVMSFGLQAVTVRLSSLVCFGLSTWLIYAAARRIGSEVAGAFAALIFLLSPIVVSASMWLSTEGPLYLATSAMLYYMCRYWTEKALKRAEWIGLGLAIGLGLLSKASFVLIGLPALAYSLWVARAREFGKLSRVLLPKAGALGLVIAGPWWLLNVKGAVAGARMARGFVGNSLGPPGPATWLLWLNTVGQSLLGHGLSIVICLVVAVSLVKIVVLKQVILNRVQLSALGVCAAAGVPIVLAQLSGTNHLLRHISPLVIPLGVAVGVLADRTDWVRTRVGVAVTAILMTAQLSMIVLPSWFPNKHAVDGGFANGWLPWRVMARREQWDWKPLMKIGHCCGKSSPTIVVLGNGSSFDPPHIEFPWVAEEAGTRHSTPASPEVLWAWRYEEGALDWNKVMALAGNGDFVVTAPNYTTDPTGKEDVYNQHNAEFSARLSQDPRFRGPIRIEMGGFMPVSVMVFVNSTLVCHLGKEASFPE